MDRTSLHWEATAEPPLGGSEPAAVAAWAVTLHPGEASL
jgi:hypothetical protein